MVDPEGRFVLTYNGEIYNFETLRIDLATQWKFRTEGDTEVLLAGLVLYGAPFLERVEGMWAFALWDGLERRLLASRDRFGEKPLYFCAATSGTIVCGSELPALTGLTSETAWTEDLDSTADYFRYGFALPGRTAYSGIEEVLPGHFLEWSPAELPRQSCYWSLPDRPFAGTQTDGVMLLRERLKDAVAPRLVADIEVGAMLSGGLDSTIIVGLAAAAAPKRLKTFTMGFGDPSYDESKFARLVSKRFGCEHHEDTLALDQPEAIKHLLAKHMGQPFADPSLLPTALVARLASRSVKVALTGDGGDELFCGYERYRARVILRWYTRLPAALRRRAAQLIESWPEPTAHHSGSLLKKAHLFLRQAERADRGAPYVAPELFEPALFALIAPALAGRGHVPPGLPKSTTLDGIDAMMKADMLVYLPQDILQKTDRSAMAHSLEFRSPFLDRGVVELAFSFPTKWHSGIRSGKSLLRRAFIDLVPTQVSRRGKQGFSVPVGAWFRSALGESLLALLNLDPGPLNVYEVGRLLEDHRSCVRDHGLRLWAIYVYLLCRNREPRTQEPI